MHALVVVKVVHERYPWALYKKHAKFRDLDEATDKGNVNNLESVSFQTELRLQAISLKYTSFFQSSSSLPIELAPLVASLGPPDQPSPPFPTSSGSFATSSIDLPLADAQLEQNHDCLPFLIAPMKSLTTPILIPDGMP